MKVAELRAELESRGLDTKGVKQILVARLLEVREIDEVKAASLAGEHEREAQLQADEKRAEAESKAQHEEALRTDAKVDALIKAAGLQYHPRNAGNRLIRYQGDCMFDFLGLCKHLGYFGGGEALDIGLYHGELRLLTSRAVRHHVIAMLAEDSHIEKEFARFVDEKAGDKTIRQTCIDLLHEGTPVGWSCFPLPDAFRLIFPVPFEEYTPMFDRPIRIPEQPQLPSSVYPPVRFAHVWAQKHYVPLVKIDEKEEQEEHNLRVQNTPLVQWKPLPSWLQDELRSIISEVSYVVLFVC